MTNLNAQMNISPLGSAVPVYCRLVARSRPACAIGLLAGCLLSTGLHAAPLLRCQIEQGGTSNVMDFKPVADPYSVKAIDVNARFRFKAVVIGNGSRIEYINIYVYTHTKREPVLLQQTKYIAPAISSNAQPMTLTGINHVYAPGLERELQYSCTLLETSP